MGEEIRMGTIRMEQGKFFLEVEGKQQELPPWIMADEKQLEGLVGKKVEVLYSEPVRQVVGLAVNRHVYIVCYLVIPPSELYRTPIVKPHPPICYIPPEWLIQGIEDKVRANIANRLLKEGIIGKEIHGKLR